jgi:thymidylate synthase (FAD)
LVDLDTSVVYGTLLERTQKQGLDNYNDAIAAGIAPEQARLFLPAYGLYVNWRWTASLAAVLHFLNQRLDSHAQWEMRMFAAAVRDLTEPKFPVTFDVVFKED